VVLAQNQDARTFVVENVGKALVLELLLYLSAIGMVGAYAYDHVLWSCALAVMYAVVWQSLMSASPPFLDGEELAKAEHTPQP
jgi:hypothetical protein